MTTGSPGKMIFNFTMPIFIGNIFQQFYQYGGYGDRWKVRRQCGTGAVGACGTLAFLIIGFLQGVTAGFTVVTAQHYGAGNMKAMKKSVASGAVLTLIVSVILTVLSMISMSKVLHLMNTPSDMYGEAYGYIMVLCGGIIAQALYNYLASVLRALGDSKRPLYFLVIAALLNIVLDLVFIIIFRLGAAGAAYATVIAQGISGILCLFYIGKMVPALHLHKEDWEMNGSLIGWQLKIGLPMAFQYSITAIGTIVVQSCLNILGSTAAAGFAAASKIEQVFSQAYVALGTTMATYCAQNMGAGKYTRIRKGFKNATLMGFAYAIVTGVIIFFGGKYMTVFFVSENLDQIMGYVDIYLRCVSVSFLPLVIVNLYRNGIQGMGYGLLPMTAGIAELIGRSGAALIASHFGSYMGICLASPAAWVLAGTLLIVMYFKIMKGKKDREIQTGYAEAANT